MFRFPTIRKFQILGILLMSGAFPTDVLANPTAASPTGELIFLRDFGTDEVGYLAIPKDAPRAGVVVAHGKFGLNTDLRLLCDRLATEGYIALAVDLFNGQVPKDAVEVGKIQSVYTTTAAVAALTTGVRFFSLSPRFRMNKVVLLGLAESSPEVLATASKNPTLSGATLLDPPVLPLPEAIESLRTPVQIFVSSERETEESDARRLRLRRMPEVLYYEPDAFRRTINERVWNEAYAFWDSLTVPDRSIADRLIEAVF